MGVNKGADLRCVADGKAGGLSLYFPAYLGDDKENKKYPVLIGRAPVGEIKRGAEGTIQLRIIPTGYEKPALVAFDYPAVEGLILPRVAEPSKERKKVSEEKKPPGQQEVAPADVKQSERQKKAAAEEKAVKGN